ncbi:viroplasmin family protein [Clostridium neonatale]
MKYYAIKKGNGVTNKIVETWEECKVLVLGYPAIYKSFKTKDEAMNIWD